MQGTTNVQASAGAVAPETRQQRAAPVPATAAGEQKGGKLSQAEVGPDTVTNLYRYAGSR